MTVNWNLSGSYFETCNCEPACPCIFLSPPTTPEECTVLISWHIDKGIYGDVKLDGLNAVLAVLSPGHMAKVKWEAALYLDQRANQSQKDALTQIFTGQAGGAPALLGSFIGQVLGIKSTEIKYKADGRKRSLSIPNVAEAEIEALAGQGGSEVKVSNPPLFAVPGEPLVVAKSKRMSYHDYGLKWEISEKNGFYSPFTYKGP
jgi:hypothetical protein